MQDIASPNWTQLLIDIAMFWAQVAVVSLFLGFIAPKLIAEYKQAFGTKDIRRQRYICIKLVFLLFLLIFWATTTGRS